MSDYQKWIKNTQQYRRNRTQNRERAEQDYRERSAAIEAGEAAAVKRANAAQAAQAPTYASPTPAAPYARGTYDANLAKAALLENLNSDPNGGKTGNVPQQEALTPEELEAVYAAEAEGISPGLARELNAAEEDVPRGR